MNPAYYQIKEPTFNCIDMDARLRGVLLRGSMNTSGVRYSMTYKAAEALTKRAKEITPKTIEMLIRGMPGTFPIIDRIWHVFPEQVMVQIVRSDIWKEDENTSNLPGCVEDYFLISGEKLLEKYEDQDLVIAWLLAREENNSSLCSPGLKDLPEETRPKVSEHTSPETFLKYYKRYLNMGSTFRKYPYASQIIRTIGNMILSRKLNLASRMDLMVVQEG